MAYQKVLFFVYEVRWQCNLSKALARKNKTIYAHINLIWVANEQTLKKFTSVIRVFWYAYLLYNLLIGLPTPCLSKQLSILFRKRDYLPIDEVVYNLILFIFSFMSLTVYFFLSRDITVSWRTRPWFMT